MREGFGLQGNDHTNTGALITVAPTKRTCRILMEFLLISGWKVALVLTSSLNSAPGCLNVMENFHEPPSCCAGVAAGRDCECTLRQHAAVRATRALGR